MADFSVQTVLVTEGMVDHHPDADRLSIIKIGGYICISAKLEDGSHRYKPGDSVVYVPEGAVVPENLLRHGFWNEEAGKGILAGTKGNRVKAIKLRGIFSQGILFPLTYTTGVGYTCCDVVVATDWIPNDHAMTEILGITKYEPPIPTEMAGEVYSDVSIAVKYDFESVQRVTDMFEIGEEVEVTEKLHGTFFCLAYRPGFAHHEAFGVTKEFHVCSKGLGAKGLFFKDNEANRFNVYSIAARAILSAPEAEITLRGPDPDSPVIIFGEIFGKGIQDLHYGTTKPDIRIFDVWSGIEGGGFLIPEHVVTFGDLLGLQRAPSLYRGPWDPDVVVKYRDGKDTISGKNIREGIVIRGVGRHEHHGRKIAKWVSPDYLLRKGNVTEYA